MDVNYAQRKDEDIEKQVGHHVCMWAATGEIDYKPRDTRAFQLLPGARERHGTESAQNPQKESTLRTPWSPSYSFQSCERINVVYATQLWLYFVVAALAKEYKTIRKIHLKQGIPVWLQRNGNKVFWVSSLVGSASHCSSHGLLEKGLVSR